jgi:hypothetical protein
MEFNFNTLFRLGKKECRCGFWNVVQLSVIVFVAYLERGNWKVICYFSGQKDIFTCIIITGITFFSVTQNSQHMF